MKSVNIFIIVIFLLNGADPAISQDGIDYGTKVDVYTTFDYKAPIPDEELIYGRKYYIWMRYESIYYLKKEIALSPDGKWIAFTTQSGLLSRRNENIWIVPAEGGEVIFTLIRKLNR